MKIICLLLSIVVPLILGQNYVVPDLDYDQTAATCDNVNVLIATSQADLARLKNYVEVTLPDRIDKLNDIYASAQKTCKIISSRRPSLVQLSKSEAKKQMSLLVNVEKLGKQIESMTGSLFASKSQRDQIRSLVQIKQSASNPTDLCNSVYSSAKALSDYLNWLIPNVRSKYVTGLIANRITNLTAYRAQCEAAACVEYDFYPTLDSAGGDISNIGAKSVAELKQWCSTNPTCLAFNTNGWVKSSLKPKANWDTWTSDKSLGFYVKKTATIPTQPIAPDTSYTFYPTFDSDSGDITNIGAKTVAELKQWCNANPTCIAFNNNGWVKNVLKKKSLWNKWTDNQNLGLYIKAGATIPPEEDYDFYPTLDSAGGDISNIAGKSVADLKQWCSANPNCLAFNSNGWVKNTLKPKANWDTWTSDTSLGFYVKKTATIPTQPVAPDTSYTFYPTLDSDGGDITNIGAKTVAELKQYCDSNSACLGFNNNGWVKNVLRPKSQWVVWTSNSNLGFYVKKGVTIPSESSEDDASYTFYPTLESSGGDIKQINGQTINQLKQYCDSNSNCLGFNSLGFVKSSLKPKNQWSTLTKDSTGGLYLKKTTSISASHVADDATYVYYPYVDSANGDMAYMPGKTIEQLKTFCNANPKCLAFNDGGWAKDTLLKKSQWSRGSGGSMYVKSSASIQYEDGLEDKNFVYYPSLDSVGNDKYKYIIPILGLLKSACIDDGSCQAVNSDYYVKSYVKPKSQWDYKTSKNLWVKRSVQIPSNVGELAVDDGSYTFYPTLESSDGDIKQITGQSVLQLKQWCDSNPTCLGFNNLGYVKNVVRPKKEWRILFNGDPKQGFYLKNKN